MEIKGFWCKSEDEEDHEHKEPGPSPSKEALEEDQKKAVTEEDDTSRETLKETTETVIEDSETASGSRTEQLIDENSVITSGKQNNFIFNFKLCSFILNPSITKNVLSLK